MYVSGRTSQKSTDCCFYVNLLTDKQSENRPSLSEAVNTVTVSNDAFHSGPQAATVDLIMSV